MAADRFKAFRRRVGEVVLSFASASAKEEKEGGRNDGQRRHAANDTARNGTGID
jgi:hypothetical protein